MKRFRQMGALCLILISSIAQANVNFRVSPLSPLINTISFDLDLPVSNAWTMGPMIKYTYENHDCISRRSEIGIRGNLSLYHEALSQGWYLGPYISYIHIFEHHNRTGRSGDLRFPAKKGIGIAVLTGYQWMWDSFNINVGLGPKFYISDISIAAEFTIGWKI